MKLGRVKKTLAFILVQVSLLFVCCGSEFQISKDSTIKSEIIDVGDKFMIDYRFPYKNILLVKISIEEDILLNNKKIEFPKKLGKDKDGKFYYKNKGDEIIGHPFWNGRVIICDNNQDKKWDKDDYIIYAYPLSVKYDGERGIVPVIDLEEFTYLQLTLLNSNFLFTFDNDYLIKEDVEGFVRLEKKEIDKIKEKGIFEEDIYKVDKKKIFEWINIEEEIQYESNSIRAY